MRGVASTFKSGWQFDRVVLHGIATAHFLNRYPEDFNESAGVLIA